jgi:O-antigen/teichoic acid export membrane protein
MSSLRRQTLWSMMPILVTSVVSIVSVPLYFKVLSAQMYAMWFYVGTLTGAFGFMDLGVGVAVGRFIGVAMGRDDQAAVEEYWATGNAIVFPFVLFFAIVFVVGGGIWGPEWFKVSGADATILRWAILWGGVSLFFSYYGQMWNILAQAHLDFKYLSILGTWTGLASTLGTVGVALLSKNVAIIMAYTTALALCRFVLLYLRGQNHYQLPLKISHFRKARLLEMLPYTTKTFGLLLSGSLLGSLDRAFLGRLAPAADFAAFGVSQNIGGRISGLSVAIMGPIFNNTARGVGGDQTKKPADVYRESFKFMFPWYSLVIIGVFFWSGPVTELWLGAKYGNAVGQTFPWIVAALCFTAISSISAAQLGGLDRVGTGLIVQTLANLMSAAGVVAGWYWWGIAGAAAGFFASRLVYVFQDALVRKWVGISIGEYFSIMPIVGRQLAVVGAVWVLFRFLPASAPVQSLGALLSGILCGGLELAASLGWGSVKTLPAT